MGQISVDELQSGMVLAADLFGPAGRFLLGKGTVLEDKHIRIAKIWGVTEAEVEDQDQGGDRTVQDDRYEPEILAQSEVLLSWVFSLSNRSHEAVMELYRICTLRLAQEIASGLALEEGMPDDLSRRFEEILASSPEVPTAPEDIVTTELELASFPDIYFQVLEVLNDPRSSASTLADVVGKDPSLSVRLLSLVNSPFYGFPSQIDSISRAIALIGGNELSLLAIGVSVVEYFKDIPEHFLSMRAFWFHSITTAVFSRILAGNKPGLSEERLFLGGLIHDIGRLVIAKYFPKAATKAYVISLTRPCPLYEAEAEVFGFDHARVAEMMLHKWNFPSSLEFMVGNHHQPCEFGNPLEPSIIHVADFMAHGLNSGVSNISFMPPLFEPAWEELDLPTSILSPAVNQATRLVSDIYHIFFGDNGP